MTILDEGGRSAAFSAGIAVSPIGENAFRGAAQAGARRRTYGGRIAAQALLAAGATVAADRPVHSAQTSFLLPGDTSVPMDFAVGVLRDGESFSTRSVEAVQGGRVIFTMVASFHRRETGVGHQVAGLDGPGPEELAEVTDTFADDADTLRWALGLMNTIGAEVRFPELPVRAYAARGETTPPRQSVWMRTTGAVSDDELGQAAGVMYLSDALLLSAALGPHGRTFQDGGIQFATLTHSVWFHAPLRVDDWFRYDQSSRWSGAARALCHGEMLDRSGRLCATTAQEGLLRTR
ncbi:acyl-CoA thioesterase [Nocardia sp. alder85J]|uniref:acyl-CoA thioesterase n=1 Tax=Nocardia sp. alder85J TaxID=2862949 RepID=UPI001CD40FA1|nr:acyl-CoA thioesterase domain-containing protein [Nocardia sp. alder85J]MCX4092410.1 thioesterase family protein [Nocardia sp. alder85J]